MREAVVGRGYRVELADGRTIESDTVVLATPAHASAAIPESLSPDLSAALRTIPFVSTATISLAFPWTAFPALPQGYGYLSPRAEGGPLVACTWTSNKFPERAPRDVVLARCFIGRAGADEVVQAGDSVLLDLAMEELRRVAGVTESPPALSHSPLARRHAAVHPGPPATDRTHRSHARGASGSASGRCLVPRGWNSGLHRLRLGRGR